MTTTRLIVTLLALVAGAAQAQDRPSEDELFGQPPAQQAPVKKPPAAPPPASPPPSAGAAGPHEDTEAQLFGSQSSPNQPQLPTGSLVTGQKEDWLKIGGQLQLRAQASAYEGTAARDWPFSSPNLLDVYLDARPNDRVRGFVLGRLSYDPTVRTTHGGGAGTPGSGSQGGTSSVGFGSSASSDNPGGVLDQLWINFDVSHRAFVTAGRQHVKWGVGKFWNPTDYLHPVKRDPLATFDARTGTTMVKVHVPWEKRGWNFYGFGIFEDLAGNTEATASRLGRIGGGARAELVLGSAELGLDAVAQDRHHPRYGADLSAGIGDFDLYAEAAFRSGGDGPRWRQTGSGQPYWFPAEWRGWARRDEKKLTPQVVVGGTWAFKYSDEDSLTVGAEYFYNSLGYDRKAVYPFLLPGAPTQATALSPLAQQDPTAFRAFYLGQHYAAVNLYLPQPGRWNDTTLIATVLGNLSDRSYVARLDASVLVLTYMTVETFVAGHFGEKGGEFRLALPSSLASLAAAQSGGSTFPSGAPIVDVGISLRVAL